MKIKNLSFSRKKATYITLIIFSLGVLTLLVWRFFIYEPPTRSLTGYEKDIIQANELFYLGKIKKGKQTYDEIISKRIFDSDKAETYFAKGLSCRLVKDYKCALDSYKRYEKLIGKDYKVVYEKAYYYDITGQDKKALNEYKETLRLLPKTDLNDTENDIKQQTEQRIEFYEE